MKAQPLAALQGILGHRFQHPELLEQALTHSSHAYESEVRDNEQMEFLGDAVLGFVTSHALFERYPNFQEGQLSKLRAHLVSARHLVQIAKELELGRFLRLGRGEEKSGGRNKATLLVNALEAVLAALYLDAGMPKAREFVMRRIVERELARLEQQDSGEVTVTDYKSTLQEILQAQGAPQPRYSVVKEEGPEHKKLFTVEVRVQQGDNRRGETRARAEASTKKQAEQRAAKEALEKLGRLQD